MPGYKHPCRYCGKFISGDSNVCPYCGKRTPVGELRCPKCKSPIEKDFKCCGHCGLELLITCPKCSTLTFFYEQCEHCGAELVYVDPNAKKKK